MSSSLVEPAKRRAAVEALRNIQFIVGSVLELTKVLQTNHFDCVISERCLINLPERQLQQDVIPQAHSLLSDDRRMILTEGFQTELDSLNVLRKQLGLPKIRVVSYDQNNARKDFEAMVKL
jgi:hypothetical protein